MRRRSGPCSPPSQLMSRPSASKQLPFVRPLLARTVTTFRANSGRTNGNCFDAEGRLISCEGGEQGPDRRRIVRTEDRKSTRLNSSHVEISYAVFCLKKK